MATLTARLKFLFNKARCSRFTQAATRQFCEFGLGNLSVLLNSDALVQVSRYGYGNGELKVLAQQSALRVLHSGCNSPILRVWPR